MSRFLEKLEKELMDRAIMNQVKLTASLTNSSFPGAKVCNKHKLILNDRKNSLKNEDNFDQSFPILFVDFSKGYHLLMFIMKVK